MIPLGMLYQTSHKLLGHYIVRVASQSFKIVQVIIIFLLAKNHRENILRRAISSYYVRPVGSRSCENHHVLTSCSSSSVTFDKLLR